MAENSYVFYYYNDQQGQRIVELRLVNVSTGGVTTTWTVSTTGHSDITQYVFEVRGAAYNATNGTLYTLIKYTDTSGVIHYRLAKTLNFSPVDTNQIVLDSSNYIDMNIGAYSPTIFCNLTITPVSNVLICGATNGSIFELNLNGSINTLEYAYANNNQGTVVASSAILLIGIYNDGSNDIYRNYSENTNYSILNSDDFITSVAYNILDYKYYYYNILTQLSVTNGTIENTSTVGATLINQENKNYNNPILFFGPIACIHSSSKVLLSDGSYKLITNVTSGDQVYSPDCKTAIVKEVVPCWLKVPNNPFHKCVVFEKDSLAPNVPSELFIIDPGHPMSFATNYDNHGLRSAKEYVNGKTIYMSDYNDVKEMFPEDMKHNRYDLVLNRGDTYVANNVIVKSRTSFKTAGYDLEVD
jgi:hypothetical protein